ncbi:MAG: hypothetical protein LBO75_01760, partial [Bifidobacteriaceae bacterium]|nr:hypothetical protein [Bifidobacteriaceae bacterium]
MNPSNARVTSSYLHSPTKRIARWRRMAAATMALALVLSGLVVVQSWFTANQANAITFKNGWDGRFSDDILWYQFQQTNEDTGYMRGWRNPSRYDGSTYVGPSILFDALGTADGNRGALGVVSIGVGPVLKAATGSTLNGMIGFNGTGEGHLFFPKTADSGAKVGYTRYLTTQQSKTDNAVVEAEACHHAYTYGAGVNPSNGYVYIPDGSTTAINGNTDGFTWNTAIYRLELNVDPEAAVT